MSELTRARVERIVDDLYHAGLVSESNSIDGHDAALRASRDAERERAKHAEQTLMEAFGKIETLTSKLEAMTAERNELQYDADAEGGQLRAFAQEIMVPGTPLATEGAITLGKLKEVVEARLAASEGQVKELENKLVAAHASAKARVDLKEQQLAEAQATIRSLEDANCKVKRDMALHLGEAQATTKRLHDLCERNNLAFVDLIAERDQLQATVTAQQEEIGRLREVLRYYAGTTISARAVEALAAKGGACEAK